MQASRLEQRHSTAQAADDERRVAVRETFRVAFESFRADAPVLLLGHHDVDGLSAVALLVRALKVTERSFRIRIVGRGENPWSAEMAREIDATRAGGVIAADLGVRAGALKVDTATIVIDHHVPTGDAGGATVVSGYGKAPIPTSSLLAYWCAGALADVDRWLWIAALGIVGDMAEHDGFPEMALARARYGIASLRETSSLLNAARRSANADAGPALELLLQAESPKDILSDRHPQTAILRAARTEVREALDRAKKTAPRIRNGIALILFDSPCQIHPLVAQAWRSRLRSLIVIAANAGYRLGWVHFSVRTARDCNLIDFLARHAPAGADENYGSGHEKATGGALRLAHWNAFVIGLGFDAETQVQA